MQLFIKSEGQGYPLVLFHGWGFNHGIWRDLIPNLLPHYTIYLVDLPGFGQTELMDIADFKRLLLTHLPEQFAVLGWSLGGLYAMQLALEEKKRVSHLISVASSPYFLKDGDWPGVQPSLFSGFLNQFQLEPEKTWSDFILLQTKNYLLAKNSNYEGNFSGLQRGLEDLMHWDFRLQLLGYDKPTCFVFGLLDLIVPQQLANVIQCKYPQFKCHLIRRASHSPFLSHPDKFFQILREFL